MTAITLPLLLILFFPFRIWARINAIFRQSPEVERSKVTAYYNMGSLSIPPPRDFSRSLKVAFILAQILIAGCEPTNEKEGVIEQLIAGRCLSEQAIRLPLYRIAAPSSWRLKIPPIDKAIEDTTQALAEYFIIDEVGKLRITLHNFPVKTLEGRISPQTQIARWQRQFIHLDDASTSITPQAFSGFIGLLFDGRGTLGGPQQTQALTRMLAWSMQLAPEHWHTLDALQQPIDERRCDITIKAIGPEEALSKHERQIIAFARSIELLDPLPMPL